MLKPLLFVAATSAFMLLAPASAKAESYQQYLDRLRDICSVDCLEPRRFQIAARKRSSDASGDMALIMDVAEVRAVGDKFELHNIVADSSALVELELFASAGIDTSFGSGVGGRTRNRVAGRSPEVVVIELDKATFTDILNTKDLLAPKIGTEAQEAGDGKGILVERDGEVEQIEATLPRLRSYFRNRRVVVRGQPRLTPVFVGARLDRRRKQVTLVVDNAEDIALLPEYDENGEAVIVDPLSK
ncbi:hypothetical protein INR77_12350 [Erythrobacter sp. SCSIO 43205]|uniref:hypothetical protein n=1 Tax=Erythrobacter sp. SCSIO 43205 TaxID=2779361 RepID=UPI001CA8380B|nr:hypothetical protein [Erythrobacter sp. SCSIO 43205]UAB77575.1 hypothetical protein INR77_12350 [Erythrobacter sp. SCSIO 43205]